MDLETALKTLDRQQRVDFLRNAYRPEREDVADALLAELLPGGKLMDFKHIDGRTQGIVNEQIKRAHERGDDERVRDLKMRVIVANRETIGELAVRSEDPSANSTSNRPVSSKI